MKKILMTLAAVLCCAMTATVFTACGSDDDDDIDTPPAQPKVVAYQVDYSLEIPQEIQVDTNVYGNLYSLCKKVEVGYIDENGQEQKEVINNWKWTKTVTYKKSVEAPLKLYIVKPTDLNVETLPYNIYTNRITILPDQLKGVTAIYDNGKSEKAPMSTFVCIPKSHFVSPNKNKLQAYFDSNSLIPEEEVVLSLKLNIQ